MSNGKKQANIYKRLLVLFAKLLEMVMEGTRDPHQIANTLQAIVGAKTFLKRFYLDEELVLDEENGISAAMYERQQGGAFLEIFQSLGSLAAISLTWAQINTFIGLYKSKLGRGRLFRYSLCRDGNEYHLVELKVEEDGDITRLSTPLEKVRHGCYSDPSSLFILRQQ